MPTVTFSEYGLEIFYMFVFFDLFDKFYYYRNNAEIW